MHALNWCLCADLVSFSSRQCPSARQAAVQTASQLDKCHFRVVGIDLVICSCRLSIVSIECKASSVKLHELIVIA